MKKYFFITLLFLFICVFKINAQSTTEYIKVGLNNYLNLNEINVNNENILIGYNDEIKQEISSDLGFNIKFLKNSFYIKLKNKFNTYEEAREYANLNKEFYTAIEKDGWYIYVKGFNTNLDALEYQSLNKIDGEIINLQNFVNIYSNNEVFLIFNVENYNLQIKGSFENISINNKEYRNIIEFNTQNDKLIIINILDIEEYLYGVVPSEMPASWHEEALKAQAVASRNYAHNSKGKHASEGYDVCNTVHCQVYNGFSGEKSSTNKAIEETRGVFAYYDNKKITAFYSSSNGGYSEDSENVWGNKVDYLRAIKDEYEEGGKVWERSFTFSEISTLAPYLGQVNEVALKSSDVTGRAISLTLKGTNGEKVLQKEEIRTFFSKSKGGSLESRNFVMQNASLSSESEALKITGSDYEVSVIGSDNINTINLNSAFVVNSENKIFKNNSNYIVSKGGSENFNQSSSPLVSISSKDSDTIKFSGKGWGHGVGMSQYGANSLAKKGYKYDEILKYYYTDIEVR